MSSCWTLLSITCIIWIGDWPKIFVIFWNNWVTAFLQRICFFLDRAKVPGLGRSMLTYWKLFRNLIVFFLLSIHFLVSFFIVILLLFFFAIIYILLPLNFFLVYHLLFWIGAKTLLWAVTRWNMRTLIMWSAVNLFRVKQKVVVLTLWVLLLSWSEGLTFNTIKVFEMIRLGPIFWICGERWSLLVLLCCFCC